MFYSVFFGNLFKSSVTQVIDSICSQELVIFVTVYSIVSSAPVLSEVVFYAQKFMLYLLG